MKRFLVLPFVLIFLINTSGTYVFFAVRLARIYVQRRHELRSPSSARHQQLEFSESQFNEALVDDGEEIKVSGKMYDVVRIEHLQKKIIVTCIHDKAEDNLFAFLDDVLEKSAKEEQVSHVGYFSVVDQITLWQWNPTTEFEFVENYTAYQRVSLTPVVSITAPPPKYS